MTKEKLERAENLDKKIRAIGNLLAVWERTDNRCVYIGIANHMKDAYFTDEIAEDIVKKLEAWKKALEVEFERL